MSLRTSKAKKSDNQCVILECPSPVASNSLCAGHFESMQLSRQRQVWNAYLAELNDPETPDARRERVGRYLKAMMA